MIIKMHDSCKLSNLVGQCIVVKNIQTESLLLIFKYKYHIELGKITVHNFDGANKLCSRMRNSVPELLQIWTERKDHIDVNDHMEVKESKGQIDCTALNNWR